MTIKRIVENGMQIAYIPETELLITDTQSALDLMATIHYETGCNRIILNKASICEDFFILSTCLAGEILQKYINYNVKLAIIGDYSSYTSKPLHDFIYESNRGKDIFFVSTLEDARNYISQS